VSKKVMSCKDASSKVVQDGTATAQEFDIAVGHKNKWWSSS
jgi:hypothetical protein